MVRPDGRPPDRVAPPAPNSRGRRGLRGLGATDHRLTPQRQAPMVTPAALPRPYRHKRSWEEWLVLTAFSVLSQGGSLPPVNPAPTPKQLKEVEEIAGKEAVELRRNADKAKEEQLAQELESMEGKEQEMAALERKLASGEPITAEEEAAMRAQMAALGEGL